MSETSRAASHRLRASTEGDAGSASGSNDPGTFFAMTRRRRKRLDDVDRHLMELLAGDARSSQRSLAQQVGVTDETVAARLRRLRDDNVIATTVVIDWEAAGYGAGAILRSRLSGGTEELAGALGSIPGLHSITVTTGCCDLLVTLLGTDLPALRKSVVEVARVKNVVVDAVDIVTASPVFKTDVHTLPLRPWRSEDLPGPMPALDDLDRALINALADAAHESNRELARRLAVSDGTVRARIRRLEDGGLIKVVTGRDPVATGEMQAYGMVFLTLEGNEGREFLDHPFVYAAHEVIGRSDLVLNVGAPSENDLALFLTDELRAMYGVRDIAVAHLVEVIAHQTHLVRLS